jgi:histidine ammonia-lyase
MTSARRAADVLDNAERVLAIEALTAAQGLDLREDTPAPGTGAALRALRRLSPRLVEDRSLSKDVELTQELLARGGLVEASSNAVGPLH